VRRSLGAAEVDTEPDMKFPSPKRGRPAACRNNLEIARKNARNIATRTRRTKNNGLF
jgi:hypothetical protein